MKYKKHQEQSKYPLTEKGTNCSISIKRRMGKLWHIHTIIVVKINELNYID